MRVVIQRSSKGAIFIIICGFILVYSLISIIQLSDDGSILMLKRIILKNTSFAFSDYSNLINMNFSFMMLPLVCHKSEPLLLILVHSAVNNFHLRRAIRNTWGRNEDNVKVLFLVGMAENHDINKRLEDESRQHHDLLQGNFIDTYHNMSYKHIMAMKYVVYHCPKAQFTLKVDDDVFVNIRNMKIFIEVYKCQRKISKKIVCTVMRNNPALRKGKWQVSSADYPESYYPTHCSGFAILYPYDVLYTLYSEAQKSRFFWIDDVFVTGIVAKKSNITHIDFSSLSLSYNDIKNIDNSFKNFTKPFLFGPINLKEEGIRYLWKVLTNHTSKATILDYLNF